MRLSHAPRSLIGLLVMSLAIVLVPIAAPSLAGKALAAVECGCTKTGDYKAPQTAAPVSAAESPKGGTYKLETSQQNNRATLVVKRAVNNTVVTRYDNVPVARLQYGFSPDGKRFAVQHAFPGQEQTKDQIDVYDLAGGAPRYTSTVNSGAVVGFSPNGVYFYVTSLDSTQAHTYVYDAATGRNKAGFDYLFTSAPGNPGQTFGVAGYGFSPDDSDRSFLLAHRDSNGQTQLVVRNLETEKNVVSTTISGGAYWRFSPCGDALGLVTQFGGSQIIVQLFKTVSGLNSAMGTQKQFSMPASFKFTTTATQHQFVTSTTTNLVANSASTACPSAPALSDMSFNATALTGSGKTSTGTVRFTPAPTSTATVTLTSSDTSALTVPASVTMSSGATTKTFTATSKAVTTTKTVTVTATYNGVSKTATVTVNPATPPASAPKVSGLTLADAQVSSGGSTTATVAIDVAAPTTGTAVTLSSSNPAVVQVPASTNVAPGRTTSTFAVQASAVSAETTVTLTATGGGQSGTARLTVRPVTVVESPHAVIDDPACVAASIPRNDDGSSAAVNLPTPINFFGSQYGFLFVNNNGNVTFNEGQSAYTPYTINANTPPIIAPFFADVDTRGDGSRLVTYSTSDQPATFAGRPAFCANWVDVGYYGARTDKLNSFQLLLVDRSDVAAGDFDIVFNYDQIQWETGEASGGSNGLGGNSAGVGYSAGTGNAAQFFQMKGTLEPGSFLDSNDDTGLTRTSRGTLQRGRHIFEVRNGAAPTGGTVSGTVKDNNGNVQVGAPVWICEVGKTTCAATLLTGSTGTFTASGIPAGSYTVRANPPTGSTVSPASVGPIEVEAGQTTTVNIVFRVPSGPPDGTTISPSSSNGMGIPSVYYGDPLDLDTTGCVGAEVTYAVTRGGQTIASGPMEEGEPGHYTAQIPPLRPNTGMAQVRITFACPDETDESIDFDIYIDPSGWVHDQYGTPIVGATVTLLRSDSEGGPFTEVPDGSVIMAPNNRNNPSLTDADGHFGWDVIPGYYKVRAEMQGCTTVTTNAMPVPPEVTDLDLRLECVWPATGGDTGGGTGGDTGGGDPTSEPTPEPTPDPSVTPTPQPGVPPTEVLGGGKLPYTGAPIVPMIGVALLLVLAGAGLVRRRTG